MSPKTNTAFTLTEVLVALILLGVLIIAISNLEITRGKMAQTTDSLILVQREATAAMERVQQSVMTGYYLWFDTVTPTPNVVWVQTIDPTAVGSPPNPAKIKETLSASPDPNWANFRYAAYAYEPTATGGNLVYYENVIPGMPMTALPGKTMRTTILCKNLGPGSLLVSNDAVPSDRFLYTGVMLQLDVTDPATGKTFTIGPTELVSRSMAAARPVGWRPPKPPGTPVGL